MEQEGNQRQCTSCGAERLPDDVFCRQCGVQLPQYCPQCGTIIDRPSRFCHKCGASLDEQVSNNEQIEYTTVEDAGPVSQAEPTYSNEKTGEHKKGKTGIIIIGAGILFLVIIMVVGILYLLDYFQSSPSTVTIPETTIPEQEQPFTPPPSTTELPIIVSFEIDPPKITTAESTMATWEVTGADMVSIDHNIGEIAHKGNLSLSPLENTEYRLTATNDAGSVTRTAMVTVIQNLNAKEIALGSSDVYQDSFEFRTETTPVLDNTISTYFVEFQLGNEHLANQVIIYDTVSQAVTNFYSIKENHREYVSDIVDIGDRAYYSTILQHIPDETELYSISFQKDNVYVTLGQISNFDTLERYARLVASRIP
ncbi:MAG: zinc ribbon domain-containing protein [Dehalococcoidia bacterium]